MWLPLGSSGDGFMSLFIWILFGLVDENIVFDLDFANSCISLACRFGSLPRNSNLKAVGDISLPLTRKRLINNLHLPFALSFLVLFFFFLNINLFHLFILFSGVDMESNC